MREHVDPITYWSYKNMMEHRGITWPQIAEYLSVSRERIRQVFLKFERGNFELPINIEWMDKLDEAITGISDQRDELCRCDKTGWVDALEHGMIEGVMQRG